MIRSWSGFQPLKELWLGDTYPDCFFDHFDAKTQDLFGKINEITRTDLKNIQQKIESFGVKVCRPKFTKVDDYLDDQDNLLKPPITPRDWALVFDDQLIITPQYPSGTEPWQEDIDRYISEGQKVKILDRSIEEDWCWIPYPCFVRVGKDIYLDVDKKSYPLNAQHKIESVIENIGKKYRIHVGSTVDHSDAVFCPVKPGAIVSTHYRNHYEKGWPGWKVLHLPDLSGNSGNGKWWAPGVNYTHYNEQVVKVADKWIGDSRETVFEVNMLVIDERNILSIRSNDSVKKFLQEFGIEMHETDFRTRGFWDGGLHCLTLDIHRTGECEDYWPDREPNGVYIDHDLA